MGRKHSVGCLHDRSGYAMNRHRRIRWNRHHGWGRPRAYRLARCIQHTFQPKGMNKYNSSAFTPVAVAVDTVFEV